MLLYWTMTDKKYLPSSPPALDSVIYLYDNTPVTRERLFAHAVYLSQQLPDRNYAINLCQNRYLFTVAYLAVLIKQQINLLPANRSKRDISQLLQEYPQSYCLSDNPESGQKAVFVIDPAIPDQPLADWPDFSPQAIASISFTSGSTGKPKKITKTWGEFRKSAELATRRLELDDNGLMILSTVPPQHMYGLETSVFWPLYGSIKISSERPFFPEDIRRLSKSSPYRCVLISSPIHLRSCSKASITWHNIAMVLSSTAPMPFDLAVRIEQQMQAPLYEIFGSTETLSYASRRPIKNGLWQPYPGIRLVTDNERFHLYGGHLPRSVALDDQFYIEADGTFELIGRSTDMIKIAGKRASLMELNRIINSIPGVEEAVYYRTVSERLGAFVVSRLSKKALLDELRTAMDEVFLPRPLTRVKQLPRNETGKIMLREVQHLIEEYDVA